MVLNQFYSREIAEKPHLFCNLFQRNSFYTVKTLSIEIDGPEQAGPYIVVFDQSTPFATHCECVYYIQVALLL